MKRSILLLVFVSLCLPLFAQYENLPIKPINTQEADPKPTVGEISIFGGVSIPAKDYTIDSKDVSTQESTKFAFGVQSVFYPVPRYGLGLEFYMRSLGSGKSTTYPAANTRLESQSSARLMQFFIVNKITANPSHKVRLYVPLAIGLAYYRGTVERELYMLGFQIEDDEETDSSINFAAYGGLGLEFGVGEATILGVEGRYNVTDAASKFSRANTLKHLDILFKVGFKF